MIEVTNLKQTLHSGATPLDILKGLNFNINAGESVAIVGPSGSGKTTLLGMLAGLDVPSGGRIMWQGRNLVEMSEDERAQLRAEQVGFVFQQFQLLGSMTALENVMLALELKGERNATVEAAALLTRVGLGERLSHYPRQVAGGEQQRVAIARAFASKPRVLFADEPTGNLDTRTGDQIADLLFELNAEQKTTLVMVTHDERLAQRCGRSIRIEAGEISTDQSDVAPQIDSDSENSAA